MRIHQCSNPSWRYDDEMAAWVCRYCGHPEYIVGIKPVDYSSQGMKMLVTEGIAITESIPGGGRSGYRHKGGE